MGINEQLKLGGGGGSASTFAKEVKFRYMSGKEVIPFRILPSFPRGHVPGQGDPMAWVPFRLDENTLTDWCIYIFIARNVGHGSAYPARRDFVSVLNFPDGGECIFTKLYHAAKSNPEWRYLTVETLDGSGKKERAPLTLPTRMLVCNIVDIEKAPHICTLGVMTIGAAYSFLNPQKGWAYMPAVNVPAEVRGANPMAAWYLGDFTDPNQGIRFKMVKGTKNGDMSAYEAELEKDSYGRVSMHTATVEQMRGRYNLVDTSSYLNRQSDTEIVEGLTQVLNGVSPSGKHEYEFLRMVLPEFCDMIPQVSTAYSNVPRSMQPGFGQQAPQQPQFGAQTPYGGPAGFVPPPYPSQPQVPAAPAPPQYGQGMPPQGGFQYGQGVQPQPLNPSAPVQFQPSAPAPAQPWVGSAPPNPVYSGTGMPPASVAAPMPPASGAPTTVPGISKERILE